MAGATRRQTGDDYLGPLERRVMNHLWTHGAATVAEVAEALNATSYRHLAYTTVMTILVRLYEKGYVTRGPVGRSYRYEAAMDESELMASVGRRELGQLIQRYGAASLAQFADDLTAADRALAERLRTLAGRAKGRGS